MAVKVRFQIYSDEFAYVLTSKNIRNYDSISLTLERDDFYHGVMTGASNSFIFVGEIVPILEDFHDRKGVNGQLFINIQAGDSSGRESSYVTVQTLKADMTTRNLIDDGIDDSVSYSFVISGLYETISDRESDDIDLNANATIDGTALDVNEILTNVTLTNKDLDLVASIVGPVDVDDNQITTTIFGGLTAPLALTVESSSDDNVQTQTQLVRTDPITPISGSNCLIFNPSSTQEVEYTLDFQSVAMNIQHQAGLTDGLEMQICIITFSIGDDNLFDEENRIILDTYQTSDAQITLDFNTTQVVTIPPENYVCLALARPVEGSSTAVADVEFSMNGVITTSFISTFVDTQVKAISPLHSFQRLLNIITDRDDALSAPLFEEDGELENYYCLSGNMVRNFPIEDGLFKTTFKDHFQAYKVIAAIGATIQDDKFTIMKLDDLYDTSKVIMTVSNVSGYEEITDTELMYNAIEVGYKAISHESDVGKDTFAGTNTYNIPIKSISNTYEQTTEYTPDDYGIALAVRDQYIGTSTEDTRYDDLLFFLDVELEFNPNFPIQTRLAPRTFPNAPISGIKNPEETYNIRLSPRRILTNHLPKLAGSFVRGFDGSERVRFATGAPNPNMISALTEFGEELLESDDLSVANLPSALFDPIEITFTAEMTVDEWINVKQNPHGMIFVEPKGKYGFIKSIDFDLLNEKATFTLIKSTIT